MNLSFNTVRLILFSHCEGNHFAPDQRWHKKNESLIDARRLWLIAVNTFLFIKSQLDCYEMKVTAVLVVSTEWTLNHIGGLFRSENTIGMEYLYFCFNRRRAHHFKKMDSIFRRSATNIRKSYAEGNEDSTREQEWTISIHIFVSIVCIENIFGNASTSLIILKWNKKTFFSIKLKYFFYSNSHIQMISI